MQKKKTYLLLIVITGILWNLLSITSCATSNSYEIVGTVWGEKGQPVTDVSIAFSDGVFLSSKDGKYRHIVSGGVFVTVKPQKNGFKFKYDILKKSYNLNNWVPAEGIKVEPTDISENTLDGATPVLLLDFYAFLEDPKYNISGLVTAQDGKGIPGVSIYFNSGLTVPAGQGQNEGSITPAVSDDFGKWGKNDLSGSVTVTAAKNKWSFIPPYALVGSESSVVNFVGTERSSIDVHLDGTKLDFDQNPEIVNNRILLPLRKIFEVLGAKIVWDPKTLTITATKDETTIKLTIGSADAYVNGVLTKLDQPPMMLNGRTLVPLRFISEAMGAKVEWDGEKGTAEIISSQRYSQNYNAVQSLLDGIKENDPVKKISFFSRAIEHDSKFSLAYYLRAKVYEEMNQLEMSMDDLKKTIELDPKYAMAYYNRGGMHIAKKEYDEAMADAQKVIELEPNFYMGYIARGITYFTLKDIKNGFADMDKAVELEPRLAVPYAMRATFYAATNQKEKAIDDYKKALEIESYNKQYRQALNELGVPGY